jgi:hypothetical protein
MKWPPRVGGRELIGMYWRVLSYHLVFTLAAGPLLCCCTVGRALASTMVVPVSTSDFRQATPTIHAESPCCALKKNAANKGSTGQKPSGQNPTDHCPCKGGSQQVKIQSEITSTDASQTRVLALDTSAVFGFDGVAVALPQSRPECRADFGTNSSLPSTFDLLFAHHNLRC